MKLVVATIGLCAVLALFAAPAQADAIFTFTETGGTVKMTSSGTLDTSKLVNVNLPDGWGLTGVEHNGTPGDIDIMGGTSFGQIDIQFGFNAGTDDSAISNPGGPFNTSSFDNMAIAGSKSFTTYSGFLNGFRQAGMGIRRADMVGALWTPDQVWTYGPGETFASLGMNVGTYSVSDIKTGETITIQIGAPVPEPGSIALLGLGLAGVVAVRRRRRN